MSKKITLTIEDDMFEILEKQLMVAQASGQDLDDIPSLIMFYITQFSEIHQNSTIQKKIENMMKMMKEKGIDVNELFQADEIEQTSNDDCCDEEDANIVVKKS